MENKTEQNPDQISEQIRALMNLLKGRAPGGLLTAFRSPQVIFGMTALNRIKNYLDGNLEEGERRVLIITDDFTEKFASPISNILGKINIDSRVWSGVK